MFPGGNNVLLSTLLCSRFRREPFALETQPWKGWSVNIPHVQSASLLFLLLPLLLPLLLLWLLLLRLLFRDATRHLMPGVPAPCINALQSAATWPAGLGPRRAPVGSVAGLLMRS